MPPHLRQESRVVKGGSLVSPRDIPVPLVKGNGTRPALAAMQSDETEFWRAFVRTRRQAGRDRRGRQVLAGKPVAAYGVPAGRRHEDRQTRAKDFTCSSMVWCAGLFLLTGKLGVRRLHQLTDTNSMMGLGVQTSSMRGSHRRHDDDREHGKHGDEPGKHTVSIDAAFENVQCHRQLASGRPRIQREADRRFVVCGDTILGTKLS